MYLDGKITLTSVSAPSEEDIQNINALTKSERKSLYDEILDEGRNSPISDKTPEAILKAALQKANLSEHVL